MVSANKLEAYFSGALLGYCSVLHLLCRCFTRDPSVSLFDLSSSTFSNYRRHVSLYMFSRSLCFILPRFNYQPYILICMFR